jgi:hypothetical protein
MFAPGRVDAGLQNYALPDKIRKKALGEGNGKNCGKSRVLHSSHRLFHNIAPAFSGTDPAKQFP